MKRQMIERMDGAFPTQVENLSMKVGVVGLGYVSLTDHTCAGYALVVQHAPHQKRHGGLPGPSGNVVRA